MLQHRTKEIKYFNIHALSRLASYISLLRVASTLDVLLEISGTAVFNTLMPGDNKKVTRKAAGLFKYVRAYQGGCFC